MLAGELGVSVPFAIKIVRKLADERTAAAAAATAPPPDVCAHCGMTGRGLKTCSRCKKDR
jgi:hypothetical protein